MEMLFVFGFAVRMRSMRLMRMRKRKRKRTLKKRMRNMKKSRKRKRKKKKMEKNIPHTVQIARVPLHLLQCWINLFTSLLLAQQLISNLLPIGVSPIYTLPQAMRVTGKPIIPYPTKNYVFVNGMIS